MESETGAKIEILGKERDGQGADEPLHAYVTSTNPEAVKKAVDKIRNKIKEAIKALDSKEIHGQILRVNRRTIKEDWIKVNDKVMIPQEEHPKIDFVGPLMGPRGNTLKCK